MEGRIEDSRWGEGARKVGRGIGIGRRKGAIEGKQRIAWSKEIDVGPYRVGQKLEIIQQRENQSLRKERN